MKNRAASGNPVGFAKRSASRLEVLREQHYIGGLQAFRPIFDGKLYPLLGFELLVAFHLEGAEMDKDILAIFAADKAIAFGGIEPFYGSGETIVRHSFFLLLNKKFARPPGIAFSTGEPGTIEARLSRLILHVKASFKPLK
jgi:hypothetical protein